MIKTNHEKNRVSRGKAEKHIQICIESKEIVKKKHPNYRIYLDTHPKKYKEIEKEREYEFWSLKLYSHLNEKGNLKDPDILVTDGDTVKYLIEVKWGAIKGCSTSDVEKILKNPDRGKIENARHLGRICKIHGPFVKDGQYYENEESKEWKCFDVDYNTKFVLVSDFQMMKDVLATNDYEDILSQLKELRDIFIIADIHKRVDDIPSFQEII